MDNKNSRPEILRLSHDRKFLGLKTGRLMSETQSVSEHSQKCVNIFDESSVLNPPVFNKNNADVIIKILKKRMQGFKNPIVTELSDLTKNPFIVLISCLLSLRTKDAVTAKASKRLFSLAKNPYKMLKLPVKRIEKAIYPVGFYPTKAKRIKEICKTLIEEYNGKVPDSEEDLLKLKGVGRKTMGIVMCYGFGRNMHIPVDSHVHQVSNRLGWVKTKTPEQTEMALYKIIPKKHWHDLNDLFVQFGQNICVPVSPFCSKCPIERYCPKTGVKRSR